MHILYGNCEELLHSLIIKIINSIAGDHASEGVRRALIPYIPSPNMSPAMLKAIFFILLNQDNKMRDALCTTKVLPYLPTVCPYKACRLYDHLKDVVVVEWVKTESVHLLELVENLKEAYLVS
jgi:hypothetical protein